MLLSFSVSIVFVAGRNFGVILLLFGIFPITRLRVQSEAWLFAQLVFLQVPNSGSVMHLFLFLLCLCSVWFVSMALMLNPIPLVQIAVLETHIC